MSVSGSGVPSTSPEDRDLQTALAQLDQALSDHKQWYKNLVRVLVVRLPPDEADLKPDAHHHCRFGQWYDREAMGALRDQPAFVAVGEAHRTMHNCARRLLQRVHDRLPVVADELDQFDDFRDRMRLAFDTLRRDLPDYFQNRDPLADVRDSTGVISDLREQQALIRPGLQQCALAVIDIDHLAAINERYGRVTGDAVLRAVAQYLLANKRWYDHLYRYGGGRLLLSTPATPVLLAASLAERLRSGISEQTIPSNAGGRDVRITVSVGVAALDATLTVEEAIARAEDALSRAKAAGRNCVEVFA